MRWLVVLAIAACGYNPAPAPAVDAPAVVQPDAPPLPADQRCTARYGALEDYELCSSTDSTCTFYVRTNNGDCVMACGGVGGTCSESRDANCGDFQIHPTHMCTETHSDQVCVCSN